MNVLTVVQNFLVGGLETRIQGEFRWAMENGHDTYLATSGSFVSSNLPCASLGISTGLDIADCSTVSGVLNAVDSLVNIVNKYQIDVIHAHPFASLLPAMLASQLTGTPFVVSLHGPASLSPVQRIGQWRMQLALGFTYASMIACVSPEVKDLVDRLVFHGRIEVYPNGVSFPNVFVSPSSDYFRRWAFIGRLDRDKKEGAIQFLNISSRLKAETLDIIGDGDCRRDLEQYVEANICRLPRIRFLGAKQNVVAEMARYDAVAGMGRVVLEALSISKPTILAGYDGVKGWVDDDLFDKAAYCNFSGRGLANCSESDLVGKSLPMLKERTEKIREFLVDRYNEDSLWKQFFLNIENLPFSKCPVADEILDLLNRHRSVSGPLCENVNLIEEIDLLIQRKERECKIKIFEDSSLADCGRILEMGRGWRIGEKGELQQWYESQLSWRDDEISRIKTSLSWRITRPLRLVGTIIDRFNRASS